MVPVAHQDRVTEVLVDLLQRARAEHDLVGRVEAVSGEQRRRHGGAGLIPSTGTVWLSTCMLEK